MDKKWSISKHVLSTGFRIARAMETFVLSVTYALVEGNT